MAMFYSINKEAYTDELDENYFQSQGFADYFMTVLDSEISEAVYKDSKDFVTTEEGYRIYYEAAFNTVKKQARYGTVYYSFNLYSMKNYSFIIINMPRAKIYTNIGIYSLGEAEEFLKENNGKTVSIINGNMQADAKILENVWPNYKDRFSGTYYYTNTKYDEEGYGEKSDISILEKSEITDYSSEDIIYEDYNINDFLIYIKYEEEFNLSSYDTYIIEIIKVLDKYENLIYISIPICGVLTAIFIAYLIMAIGYKKNKEGIDLNDIDKIPLEIVLGIILAVSAIMMVLIDNFYSTSTMYYKLYLSAIITEYLIIYVLVAIGMTTIIKRIKAKTIIKNTITWRLLVLCQKLLKKVKEIFCVLTKRANTTLKIIIYILVYLIAILCVAAIFGGGRNNNYHRYRDYNVCIL